ncbi:retrovirus-related pol polyprotein from transposon TNT 1-94 [Tanacetum coccineum]
MARAVPALAPQGQARSPVIPGQPLTKPRSLNSTCGIRATQLPQDIRKTNKRVSFSTGVIPTTSVSIPQLKSNQLEDRVMPNNSQGKKQEVEDHRSNFKFSNNKTSVTACNYSLNAKTSNVNFLVENPNSLSTLQRTSCSKLPTVRTDKGTEFLNKTLHAYFAKEGIRHETSTARTPEQNGVVERQNRTLVEAARTMLSAAKVPLDGENLDKMKEKDNVRIMQKSQENSQKQDNHEHGNGRAHKEPGECYQKSTSIRLRSVFNKRTRIIVETIHVNFDELPQMASDYVSSDPGPQCSTTVLKQDSLSPGPQSPENVSQVAEIVTTSNELELLYSPMFSELLNGTSHVVSKSSAVHAADNPDKRQQLTQTHIHTLQPMLQIPTSIEHSFNIFKNPTQVPTATAPENITFKQKPILKNCTII